MDLGEKILVEEFFDAPTSTFSYLVLDRMTGRCAVIDSVLDYDLKSGRTGTASADRIIKRIHELGACVDWILETHVHADHLTAAQYLKHHLGGRVAISDRIRDVQEAFSCVFNLGETMDATRHFDVLLGDGETLQLGSLTVLAIETPGHTPACMSYLLEDAGAFLAFVGDTLFMPDSGTARCDFPGGDARLLFKSIQRILSLPPATQLFICHDYRPGGRPLAFTTTVADQRAGNIHTRDGASEDAFVAMRQARDATLDVPVLMLPSIQINMRAGDMPAPESNGVSYLKVPLNAF